MCSLVTSVNLGGVMVSTLARNARDEGSIVAIGALFPISITPMTIIYLIILFYYSIIPLVYFICSSIRMARSCGATSQLLVQNDVPFS